MNIAIRIEDGVVQEVTSDDRSLVGARVAVIQQEVPERIVEVEYEAKLSELIRAGTQRTMCHAIGIACELAGERMIKLSQRLHDDPVQMINEVHELVSQLSDAIGRAGGRLGE